MPVSLEELQRQVVRLDRDVDVVVAQAQVRVLERAGAAAEDGPVGEAAGRLPPPRRAQVRVDRADPAGARADLARGGQLVPDPRRRDPDGERERERGDHPGDGGGAAEQPPPLRPELGAGEQQRPDGDGGSDPDEHRAEDPAVVGAHRGGLPVGGDPVEREREPSHRDRGNAGERERAERLEPLGVEQEPADGDDRADEDAAAREGEQDRDDPAVDEQDAADPRRGPVRAPRGGPEAERQGEVAEQGERVPVADRRTQPRRPLVVRVEAREDLAGEGPDHDGAEHDGERPGGVARPQQHRPPGRRRPRRRGRRARGSGTPSSGPAAPTRRPRRRSRRRTPRAARARRPRRGRAPAAAGRRRAPAARGRARRGAPRGRPRRRSRPGSRRRRAARRWPRGRRAGRPRRRAPRVHPQSASRSTLP